MTRASLLACLAVGAVVSTVQGEDWTRFRGPNGSGVGSAEGIPVEFSVEDCLWRIQLPGKGHSSPAIIAGKLFITSADPDSAKRFAMGYDAVSGESLWVKTYDTDTHRVHARNSYASSSPAVDDERVYVCWATPDNYEVLALRQADGELVWRRSLSPFKSQHGFGTSPMVLDGLVILTNDQLGESFIVALEPATGEIVWKTPRDSGSAAYGVPCVYSHADGRKELIVCSTANGISGLDPKTGKTNWSADVFTQRSVASPVCVGDLVLGQCGQGGGGTYFVAVRPPAKAGGEAEVAYSFSKGAPYVPTPVAADGLVFLVHDRGTVMCIDANSGETIYNERIGGGISGSPV
ncbi:MAG: PQQ-binding-like beta-propeller repeat protein, partial [Pirellulales bacterium]